MVDLPEVPPVHKMTEKPAPGSGAVNPHEAVRELSAELHLYREPSSVMRVLLASAGARRGAILREESGTIRVEAIGSAQDVDFPQDLFLEGCAVVCERIVGYVVQAGEPVILGDASRDPRFASHRCLTRASPVSIACIPIIHAGRCTAIVYLENDRQAQAFAENDFAVIAMLASHAAIAVENARLHQALVESEQFLQSTIDALPSNLAILDTSGKIIAVNGSWKRFADNNGFTGPDYGVDMNYLEVCERAAENCAEAKQAAASIRSVAGHQRDECFMEYACHSPDEQRWFQMCVSRFKDRHAERLLVTHQPITEIKGAEQELSRALEEIEELRDRLQAENLYLHEELKRSDEFHDIVGVSDALRAVFHKLEQVAATDATVLILGETGTGKELIARAIHNRSLRQEHPLVKVNCASLPAALIESELFGHEKGAFTGALAQRIGRFELADRGTIFLDEIGDLPLELQAKLLRVLQEGEFERLGSSKTIKVDVRVIAATNRHLEQAVFNGTFRSDLYYRLNVFPIWVPPLRDRTEDIPLLVWYFVAKSQGRLGKHITTVPKKVMNALMSFSWPGNVRELENVIERAIIMSPGSSLVLDEMMVNKAPLATHAQRDNDTMEEAERSHVLKILEACNWKVKGKGNAAERLGLHPNTLRYRIQKLGLKRPST